MYDNTTLDQPKPWSSLSLAISKADKGQQTALYALYTLHKKWREAAIYIDQHQAVTTLNWWHQTLEQARENPAHHPALAVLKPWFNHEGFYQSLQSILHGHMHWHHLTRVETIEQLKPTIDAIANGYAQAWLCILGGVDLPEYAINAAHSVWWVDQIRHIGHNLSASRLWLPMSWLKELNLPAHQLLNQQLSPIQRHTVNHELIEYLNQVAKKHIASYEQSRVQLGSKTRHTIRSLDILVQQRVLLLDEIMKDPRELWTGLISLSPRSKWWHSL